MYDLMTASGRQKALRGVSSEVDDISHLLARHGTDLARAVGRGGTPAWITAGGAVLAAGVLYWLMRPASEQETKRKAARNGSAKRNGTTTSSKTAS